MTPVGFMTMDVNPWPSSELMQGLLPRCVTVPNGVGLFLCFDPPRLTSALVCSITRPEAPALEANPDAGGDYKDTLCSHVAPRRGHCVSKRKNRRASRTSSPQLGVPAPDRQRQNRPTPATGTCPSMAIMALRAQMVTVENKNTCRAQRRSSVWGRCPASAIFNHHALVAQATAR